ncbi:MAG: SUMF1/EgtB/PvdO family nonheme iron enzyme [Planctomycetes bacterium]|nr:SUMF1/EgtB/PvdO family nonheme iron enzyme [Planctomycetota bacterium]
MKALDPSAIAKAVRDHLRSGKETQAQFALRAGVSEPTISRLLGDSPPQMRATTLRAIVTALPSSVRLILDTAAAPDRRSPIKRVFLSSTYIDLEERRRQIIEAIESFPDLKCVAMERFTATERPTVESCLEQAREADLFIGILAYRYGWIPDGEPKSITELEHDAAHTAGIDRLMFVVDERKRPMVPDVDADPMPERWPQQDRLTKFKQRLSSTGITPRTFGDDTALISLVIHAIVAWRERQRLPTVERPREDEYAPQQDEMRYRDALLAEHRHLRFVGFTSRQRAPMSIEELFVPLLAKTRVCGPGDEKQGKVDAESKRSEAMQEGIQLSRALALARQEGCRGVVIEGRPGAGKTTHLRRLAFGLLTQGPAILDLAPDEKERSLLPVFIPLRQVRENDLDGGLAAVIAHTLPAQSDLGEDFARRLIERGRLVLLFDGLDEVSAKRRETIAAWLDRELKACPDSYFVLTSRPAGYSDATREALAKLVIELEIQPLSDVQISDFVNRWYRLVETSSTDLDRAAAEAHGAKNAQELLERLAQPVMRASRVQEMTANPLLLTIICLVHRDGSYLPDDAVRLYEESSQVLLETWRRAKGLAVEVTADKASQVLRPLAYFLHQEPGRTSSTAAEIAPEIADALREIGWPRSPEDFLHAVRDESGLLVGLGDDRYQFLHLGFQEYFAALEVHARVAEHALDDDREKVDDALDELKRHFGASWWREVILLLLKRADRPHLFVPLLRYIAEHDLEAFGRHGDMVDACIRDSFVVRGEPFVHALGRIPSQRKPGSLAHTAMLKCAQCLLRVDPAKFLEKAAELVELGDDTLSDLVLSAARQRDIGLARELAIARNRHRRAAGRREVPEDQRALQSTETRRVRGDVELVRIEGGTFAMGGRRHDDEKPIHEVRVPGFWLARTPVTNAQYQAFVTATKHAAPPSWKNPRFNAPDQPVVEVSWDDARAFCEWAGLRLPSEAEWEYACRAGTTTEYWFGDDEDLLWKHGWFRANSEGATRPVGLTPASPFGLHDMHGNVREWCEDTWHENYEGAPTDGSAWVKSGSSARVLRGGSWYVTAGWCRSAYRCGGPADVRIGDVGFRPASSSLD